MSSLKRAPFLLFLIAALPGTELRAASIPEAPLRATVLLHVSPLHAGRAQLSREDRSVLLSTVRLLRAQTNFHSIRLIAFNLDQQKELLRTDEVNGDTWQELNRSIDRLKLATVPISVLRQPDGYQGLLSRLIAGELAGDQHSDAVFFIGPPARQKDHLRVKTILESAQSMPRFFYLECRPYFSRGPDMPDVISHITRDFGGKVFHVRSGQQAADALERAENAVNQDRQTGGTR